MVSLSLGLAIGLASSTALSAAVPVNSVAPIISGLEYAGQTLSLIGLGTWSNSPTSYAYQWYADAVAIPGETGTTYVVAAAYGGATITCRVTAINGAGAGTPTASNGIAIGAPYFTDHGADPTYSSPTTSPASNVRYFSKAGDNSDGLTDATAFNEAGDAIADLGGTPGVVEGLDSEDYAPITMFAGLTVKGRGTARPYFSGATLASPSACDAGDAAVVGAGWANCVKFTVPIPTAFAAYNNLACLNITETISGVKTQLPLAYVRAADGDHPEFSHHVPDWSTADSAQETATLLDGFTSAALGAAYATADMTDALVNAHVYANTILTTEMAGFDGSDAGATGAFTLADQTRVKEDLKFCLLNVGKRLTDLSAGAWCYRLDAATVALSTNVTVYIRWKNSASNDFHYATAAKAIETAGASNLALEAIMAGGVGGDANSLGVAIGSNTGTASSNVSLLHVTAENTAASTDYSYGLLHFVNVTGLSIDQCTLRGALHGRAALISGCTSPVLKRSSIKRTEYSTPSFSNGSNITFNHNLVDDCCFAPHAGVIFYGLSAVGDQTNAIVFGNKFGPGCLGAITTQNETGFLCWFNEIHINAVRGKPVDMNASTTSYGDVQDFHNNTIYADPDDLSVKSALHVVSDAGYTVSVKNNMLHGLEDSLSAIAAQGHNLFTALSGLETVTGTDITRTTLADTVTFDASKNATLTTDGPAGRNADDLATEIAARKISHTNFDWDNLYDADGNAIGSIDFIGAVIPGFSYSVAVGTLSLPVSAAAGATSGNVGVTTTSSEGQVFAIAQLASNTTPPSAAQVYAGADSTGAAAPSAGSSDISASGAQSVSLTGLTKDVAYDGYIIERSPTGALSAVQTAPEFTPSTVLWTPDLAVSANLILWHDPADAASVTSSGGAVEKVVDRTGVYEFYQATAGAKPQVVAINGKTALDFSAATADDRRMVLRDVATHTAPVYAIAGNAMSALDGDTFHFFAWGRSANVSDHFFGIVTGVSSLTFVAGIANAGSSYQRHYMNNGVSSGNPTNTAITTGATMSILWDGTNRDWTVDGKTASHSTTIGENAKAATGAGFVLGGSLDANSATAWAGQLGDIVIYDDALTAGEQDKVEGYLAWKWGSQANLDASHPYKAAPPTV